MLIINSTVLISVTTDTSLRGLVVPQFLHSEVCTKLALSSSRVDPVLHSLLGVAHPLWGHKYECKMPATVLVV